MTGANVLYVVQPVATTRYAPRQIGKWVYPTRRAWFENELGVLLSKDRCSAHVVRQALGASGWWSLNAIFGELPAFTVATPNQSEGKKMANLLSVACQLGNVFTIAYKAFTGYCLGAARTRVILPYAIVVFLVRIPPSWILAFATIA